MMDVVDEDRNTVRVDTDGRLLIAFDDTAKEKILRLIECLLPMIEDLRWRGSMGNDVMHLAEDRLMAIRKEIEKEKEDYRGLA